MIRPVFTSSSLLLAEVTGFQDRKETAFTKSGGGVCVDISMFRARGDDYLPTVQRRNDCNTSEAPSELASSSRY